MGRKKDIYQTWEATGQLPAVMAFIAECSKRLVTQREMCKHLNIDEATFSELKGKHPEIAECMVKAKLDLKKDLAGAMYKMALGFETIEETQDIEDGGKGKAQKRKIHRVKKQVGPSYKAIVYLLTKHFGKEYSERYEELRLMERKLEDNKETWENAGEQKAEDRDEEDQ